MYYNILQFRVAVQSLTEMSNIWMPISSVEVVFRPCEVFEGGYNIGNDAHLRIHWCRKKEVISVNENYEKNHFPTMLYYLKRPVYTIYILYELVLIYTYRIRGIISREGYRCNYCGSLYYIFWKAYFNNILFHRPPPYMGLVATNQLIWYLHNNIPRYRYL